MKCLTLGGTYNVCVCCCFFHFSQRITNCPQNPGIKNMRIHWGIQLIVCLFVATEGNRIENCPSGELEAVRDSDDFTLTCVEYTGEAQWIRKSSRGNEFGIGICNSSACTAEPGWSGVFSLTHLSPSSSRLDFGRRGLNIKTTGATYRCGLTARCTVVILDVARDTPVIKGYSSGQVLYENDSLVLTCEGSGSDPDLTSVTLTLTGHGSSQDSGHSTTLTVPSLVSGDDGAEAECTGQFTGDHDPTSHRVTLTVYSPPSAPAIRRSDGSQGAYLENDPVILTCDASSLGHPQATLVWSGHRPGEVSSLDNSTSRLHIRSADGADNGRELTCRATNAFTRRKQLDISDTLTLQVYYAPVVTLTGLEDNQCSLTSQSCTMTDGQRLHVRSEAESNPAPATYSWRLPDGRDLGNGADLDLNSVTRNQSGVYRLQVVTGTVAGDNRLPLKSSLDLNVIVIYPPSGTSMQAGGKSNVTVAEDDVVNMTCQSRGRPTPALQLRQSDVTLRKVKGMVMSVGEERSELKYDITAQCHSTATYTCRAHNGIDRPRDAQLHLFVTCSPRLQEDSPELPSKVTFESGLASVVFPMTVYPAINTWTLQFHGAGSKDGPEASPARKALYAVFFDDAQSSGPQQTTCYLIFRDAKEADAGFYTLSLSNGVGDPFTYTFKLVVKGDADSLSTGEIATISALGTAGVMSLAGSVAAVVMWQKGWVMPLAQNAIAKVPPDGLTPGQ